MNVTQVIRCAESNSDTLKFYFLPITLVSLLLGMERCLEMMIK